MVSGSELWNNRITFEMTERILPSGRRVETFPGLPDNLYQAVSAWAAKTPDKTAVSDSFGRAYTYAQFVGAADRFAGYLYDACGIRYGSHVALALYSTLEFAVAYLAVIKLGAVAVMLPTKYRRTETASLVRQADLDCVICDEAFTDHFEECDARMIIGRAEAGRMPFEAIMGSQSDGGCGDAVPVSEGGSGENRLTDGGTPEDICVMMFTSGTTSQSKGVMLSNLALMHAAAVYQKAFDVAAEDSTVIPVPIYMITGLSALFGLMLFSGGTVYLQQFFKARDVLACVRDNRITFMHAAPTVYALLIDERENFPELPSLRCLACGGGRTTIDKIEAIHKWLPDCEFHTVYGMTETCSPGTILPEDASKSPYPTSNGIPVPGLSFKIADENGKELPAGENGEILMKGTNLLSEYYKKETPSFADGWLHTGDIGYLTEEGYCYVVDRIKDMINRGGEKVISSDVEDALLSVDGIADAAVVGIPHDVYGEAPAALVVTDASGIWDEASLRAELLRRIAGYKVPVRILFSDKIPQTPNGKIDKKAIRTLF